MYAAMIRMSMPASFMRLRSASTGAEVRILVIEIDVRSHFHVAEQTGEGHQVADGTFGEGLAFLRRRERWVALNTGLRHTAPTVHHVHRPGTKEVVIDEVVKA